MARFKKGVGSARKILSWTIIMRPTMLFLYLTFEIPLKNLLIPSNPPKFSEFAFKGKIS
jgi:hypothetical protein